MDDLKAALNKKEPEETTVLSLIKVIRKKNVTVELLHSTLIGKLFSKIVSMKDQLQSKEIIELSENTLNIWKKMNKAHVKAKKEKEKANEPYKIPYIPTSTSLKLTEMGVKGNICKKFIEIL